MSKSHFVLAAAFAVFISHSASAQCPAAIQRVCDAADANQFASVLTGDQEPAGGPSNAAGFAAFTIDRDTDLLTYRIEAGNLTGISGAHIHRGTFGVPGPVLIDLMTNDGFEDGVLEGSVSANGALLDQIFADPGAFFVNVHTPEFPQGAIRGQLNGRGLTLMAGDFLMPGASALNSSARHGVFSLGFVDDNPSGHDVRVDFDMMTEGVTDFDSAVIREGNGTSIDDTDLLELDTDDGLVNGRVHGSVRMSRTDFAQVIANPSGFHVQFRSPTDGTLNGALGEALTTFVPIFGRTEDAFGNLFNSDLRLFNPGNRTVNVFIQFFPAGATDALAGHTALVRLAPGEAQTISDAMQTLFGRSRGVGALRIVTSAQVLVDSEVRDGLTENDLQTSSHNPRFGQFVSGIASCHATTNGVLTSLSAGQSIEDFRTNLLLTNPSTRTALARFELRDAQGRLIDTRTQRVGGNQGVLLPINGASGMFRNANGTVKNGIVTMTADTPLFFGASVIRTGSGEARFMEARDVSR